jgi:capsular polysaccharide export protein
MFRPPSRPLASAAATLFPELAAGVASRLTQGLLRAPRRGRMPAPVLSLLPRDDHAAPKGAETPNQVLARSGWEDIGLLERAAAARRALVEARVGGTWWNEAPVALQSTPGCALVVFADRANSDEAASNDRVLAMLDCALSENPRGRVVIAATGRVGRQLRARLSDAAARGAVIVDRPFDPWAVLERVSRVYSAGDEIGFLALLAGVPVSAFGEAFYAGWGLTADRDGVSQRSPRRTIDEIFAGVCLVATRYRDPFRSVATSFENALAIVVDWRRMERANRQIAVCVGVSFWKRRRVADFVRTASGAPAFRRDAAAALAAATAAGGAIAGWASRLPDGLAEKAAHRGVPLIRIEDGFIRSVGLGSDFLPPASLVFDRGGMYYDPRSNSDLNHILRETEFGEALLTRAERLIALLVARSVTKYNLPGGGADGSRLPIVPGRCRILVPGQVEDDLSIVHGAGTVRTNLDLLAEVRRAKPDAYILYKPHPDVLAGHRKGAVAEEEARRFADLVVAGGAITALLGIADELHTMTSLAGFEALLRGCRVVVYGRPFYAGWGLTEDRPSFDRGRRLSLVELIAGTLILYPRYLDPLTQLPCGPEVIVERLDRPDLWRAGLLVRARRLQGRIIRRFTEGRSPQSVAATTALLQERPHS